MVYLIGMYNLPPSARWLVLQQRFAEARASLGFVQHDHVEFTLAEIRQSTVDDSSKAFDNDDNARFCSPSVRPAMIVGIGCVVLQQITGQPSVLYYADTIFEEAGVQTAATIGVGAFKLAATLASVFFVEKAGRRVLLLTGIAIMLAALIILSFAFLDDTDPAPGMSGSKLLIIAAM